MNCLTQRQHDILMGGLLGDVHIQKTSSSTGYCRVRWSQRITHKAYVEWIYRQYKDPFCLNTKPPYIENKNRKNNVGESACMFYTSYSSKFIPYHSNWYVPNNNPQIKQIFVKIVPLNISELLVHPLALATWYLDDGLKRNDTQSCRIATHGFSKKEVISLQDCLQQNFGISSQIEKHGQNKLGANRYQIALLSRTGGYKTFRSLIYDVVKAEIPSMLYKVL